ncbi:hypothetical protein TUMSATVNIG1_34580 [Vibrio nigripulchritudo]|nr:hypothetical protein VNTUMSATTG_34290 [Vibrio nigripulchritudo]BDU32849.1 hypothetical protein TUMSATVNIG1_34580 [Vibrio nigripulchritudo]
MNFLVEKTISKLSTREICKLSEIFWLDVISVIERSKYSAKYKAAESNTVSNKVLRSLCFKVMLFVQLGFNF